MYGRFFYAVSNDITAAVSGDSFKNLQKQKESEGVGINAFTGLSHGSYFFCPVPMGKGTMEVSDDLPCGNVSPVSLLSVCCLDSASMCLKSLVFQGVESYLQIISAAYPFWGVSGVYRKSCHFKFSAKYFKYLIPLYITISSGCCKGMLRNVVQSRKMLDFQGFSMEKSD